MHLAMRLALHCSLAQNGNIKTLLKTTLCLKWGYMGHSLEIVHREI